MDENVRFRVSAESDLPKLLSDLDALIRKQNELGDENSRAIRSMNSNMESHSKQYSSLSGSISGVKNLLLTAFGIDQIKEAISKIFDLTATYQKYTAALTVSMGSQQKATEALQMLQNYADKSNFELDELADTFSKFAGRNVILGRENMEKLGDVANALQKPFKDLGEAILDINNTERWTELGIKAKTSGDKVALTFKGVTIEAERTEQSVMLATAAFGTLNGVQGATEKQALTLAGRWSSLSDATAGLAREAGNGLLPVFEAVIETGISLAVGMKNSAQEGGLLNAIFMSLKGAGVALWTTLTELTAPIKTLAVELFPSFFGSTNGTNEILKVMGLLINNLVIGPFHVLMLILREGSLAIQGFSLGLLGIGAGVAGVSAALNGNFKQMGVMFEESGKYFTDSGNKFSSMKDVWNQTAQTIENSNARILNSHQVTAVTVADITTNLTRKQQEAVAAENQRWEKLKSTLEEGTAKYAQADYEHNMNLLKAKGEYNKMAVDKDADKHKQLKEQAFLSASEIAVLTKTIQEDSLKDQLALVDAKMKVEIEKINSHKVDYIKTEEDAALAIEAVILKSERAKEEIVNATRFRLGLDMENYAIKTVEIETKLTLDVQASEVQRLLNTQLTEKEKQKAKLDTLEQIRKLGEEEQKIIKETEDIEAKSHKNRIKAIIGFLGEMSPELAQFAQFAISVVDNIDIITGKSEQFYKKQAEDAKVAMDTSKVFFGETSEQYNQAKLKSAEANKDLAEAQAKSSEMSMDMAMALADLVKKVFGMVSETIAGSMDGILEGLDTTAAAFQRFTDMSVQMNRDMIDATLEDTAMSFDERKAALDEFMQYEKDTLYGNERLQNEINTTKNSVELAKWSADRQGEFVKNLTNGPEGIIANWKLVFTWRQQQSAREEELARQQTIFEQNQAIQRAQQQIETYKQMADEKIRIAEETRDAEIAAQKATNEVITNELDVLDTKRKQLLDSWLERKLKDLEDDKALALEQAATEEEKSNIIIKYQGLVEAAHAEHKDAELDKSKQINLATEELKAQETDFIKNKENETANAIRDIQRQTTAMIRQANNEIFEANKQIVIAELQGEIAKLKAKRWFMNAGKVDSAVATIEGVISSIRGASLGGGVNTGGVDSDMGTNEKYEESGKKADEIARQAEKAMENANQYLNNAQNAANNIYTLVGEAQNNLWAIEDARNKAKVEKPVELAEGTNYVEGFGYPDGRDTVPAWIDKGERILSADMNEMLGGRELSNKKLVDGYLAFEKLKMKFGDLRIEEFGRMNFNLEGDRLGTSIDVKGLEKRIDTLIDTVRSKPELKINVDANRVSIAEISHNQQHVAYYENLYNR